MSPTLPPRTRPPLPNIEVKARGMKDPGFLDLENQEPGRHYRWVRCRSDEHMLSIVKTKLLGYVVEKFREGGPRPIAEFDQRPDGVIAIGDLILMSCSQDQFDSREKEAAARSEALFASATAQTKEMAKDKGITLVQDPDHNT